MSRSRTLFVFSLLLSLVCLLSATAVAQYGASLQGTVTDESGAVISGAHVVATDQATGVSHSAATDKSGFYRVNELPPGRYRIDVEAGSFKKTSKTDVEVSAEQPTPVNVTLDTGSASETVPCYWTAWPEWSTKGGRGLALEERTNTGFATPRLDLGGHASP